MFSESSVFMLVFIDESGDTGLKIVSGSSKYFGISLVVFRDHEEASACDMRIDLLRSELSLAPSYEFHFKRNSRRVREEFLRAISRYDFFYYGIVINKQKLFGAGFKDKKSFYKYVCSLVFENAKEKISDAIVVIDESSGEEFQEQLSRYLRRVARTRDGHPAIKKVKMQRSSGNNLIQLADYVASIICRSVQEGTEIKDSCRKLISHREIFVQFWPK